ncbi:MAG: hypothetical protein EHM23_04515 [Acidobacteria bacterium]|nr:MAG: hypothetical protein EHM23_04515 [Acidobacteriota bacterium]
MSQSCFDLRLASSPTRHIPVRRVVDLLVVTHAPHRVAQYRQAMLSGDRFPPVSVLPVFGWFLLTDGHKRFTAYKSLQTAQIPVEIWTIPQSVAHLGRQTSKEVTEACRLVSELGRDPQAGTQLKKFLWSRVVHYRRLGRSLWTKLTP